MNREDAYENKKYLKLLRKVYWDQFEKEIFCLFILKQIYSILWMYLFFFIIIISQRMRHRYSCLPAFLYIICLIWIMYLYIWIVLYLMRFNLNWINLCVFYFHFHIHNIQYIYVCIVYGYLTHDLCHIWWQTNDNNNIINFSIFIVAFACTM